MKHNGRSLEEQRQALLEQIHASRAVYRRMLNGETEESNELNTATMHGAAATENNIAAGATKQSAQNDPHFPRSMTMRWIMQHPYYTAATIVGIAWLIPKVVKGTGRAGKKVAGKRRNKAAASPTNADFASQQPLQNAGQPVHGYPQTIYVQQPASQKTGALAGIAAFGGTALTSLLTIATMIMRDPAKMQMAMKMFSTASQYLQNRRGKQTTQQVNQTPR